jgi:peptidoglycan/xylan/chitin deacetylase (PgdA/CDA1 family)
MFKYTIPHLLRWIYPNYTWKVKTSEKVVYFTFDDGPHPEITPWVLEQLAIYDAKATFFMVGDNMVKYPQIVSQVQIAGCKIGNHTFNHLKGWKTKNDMLKSHQVIMWDRLSCDYEANLNIQKSLNAMKLLPANGSIFVFHDSEKAFQNLKILLPQLLHFYKENGYSFCTI